MSRVYGLGFGVLGMRSWGLGLWGLGLRAKGSCLGFGI